jgi:hypothetical protein
MFARKNDDVKVDDEVEALRAANGLTYVRPSNMALVDRRVMKSYNFSSNVYELGSTMQMILNSGGDALWPPSCYLRLEYTASSDLDFGASSVLALIKAVRFTHRSGEILEYIDNVNLLSNLRVYWEHSTDDYRKISGMLGFEGVNRYQNKPVAGVNVACIPMSLISGLFSNTDQYMPPALTAGMKIELELAPNQFITVKSKTTPQITNIKPTLVCDSAQLFDVVNKQMLSEMADVDQSGLQYVYNTFFNSYVVTGAGGSSINLDVQQSCSLVNKIIGITRDNNMITSTLDGADANLYIQPFTNFQYRLGSLYWPQQIIKVPSNGTWDSTQENSKEWYTLSLMAFQAYVDEFHKAAGKAACIQFYDYGYDATNQSFDSGSACISFSGEKSASGLTLTGEPTNNSRILNASGTIEYLAGSGNAFPLAGTVDPAVKYNLSGGVRFDTFLGYTRVANLMGDNCVVDR